MSTTEDKNGPDMFEPIRLEKVSEKVASQLKAVISQGLFRVGDRLPSERELAEKMGVSRPSVREAIQLLAVQGILETVHGGGSIVRNLTEQIIGKPIEIFLRDDRQRVLELTEVRAFMEAWAARQAAIHRTEEELARMGKYLDMMERDFLHGEIRFEVDFQFHTEIAAATHNTIYLHLIHSIYELLNYSIMIHREQVFVAGDSQRKILDHHRQVFTGVQERNPEAAEAAMKSHLLFVVSEFKKWSSAH